MQTVNIPIRLYLLAVAVCSCCLAACDNTIVDEETPRSFVSRIVADTVPERNEIAAELLANGKKPVHLTGPLVLKERGGIKPAKIEFGWISSTGTFVAYSKTYAVIVILEPTISTGSVKWTCIAYPSDAKSSACQ